MHPKLIGFILLTALTGAWAQEPVQIPPPTPPFVAPVPEKADWIIAIQSAASATDDASKRPALRIVSVHTIKTGNIKLDRIQYASGTAFEIWAVDHLLFYASSTGTIFASDASIPIDPDAKGNPAYPMAVSGFPGVAWVRRDHFDQVVAWEKRPCYHYSNGTMEAWIDVASRYPMAYKLGNALYRYQFNAAPEAMLTLPPAYQKTYDTCRKGEDHRKEIERFLGGGR